MRNKHSKENISEEFEATEGDALDADNVDYLQSKEERGPVYYSDTTVMDELDDYIFLKQKRKKKASNKQREIVNNFEDYPLLKSKRSSSKHHHHKQTSKKKKMKTWKKILISIGCTLLAVVLLLVGTLVALFYKGNSELITTDYVITAPDDVEVQNQGEYIVYNGKTYKFNEKVTSILLMGVDKRDLEGTTVNGTGGQADVNVLMALNTETGKVSLINISRDTMTDVTEYSAGGAYVGTVKEQLCLAYSFGDGKESSCENQVDAVQRLFYNIPIQSYFSLDLDGIAAINDSVGGVDVVSPSTIGQFTQGESYHLEGDMAESFVRVRDEVSVDANNGRMERQQVYINSFISTVLAQTKADISTPVDLFNAAASYSCTNLNASKISYLAFNAVSNGGMSYEMLSVPGEVKMGESYAEFYPDETGLFEMFLSVYYLPMD
jgi:LCP family protein required for cell wall assembly